MSLLVCSCSTFSSLYGCHARSMLVGKAAILFVSSGLWLWAVVKVIACLVWGFFFFFRLFDMYDHLSVLSRLKEEIYLWPPSVLVPLPMCTGLGNHHCYVASLACSRHSSCDNQRTWGCTTCWVNEDLWIYTGSFYYLCQGGCVLFVCYFMVMLDHVQWGLKFSELLRWMWHLPR